MFAARRFRVENHNDVTVIELLDARLFDALLVSELQDDLVEFLAQEQPARVLVNFQGVTHCSTSVINAMLQAKKRVSARQGQLKLCCLADTIREAYRMLNLEGTVFEIYDSADEALRSF